jgi:hypothetical protein
MNIYQLASSILPPEKRSKTITSFINSLSSPIQWLSDTFDLYINDANIADYTAVAYSYLDEVRFEKKVYLSLVDNNTSVPTDTNYWYCYQQNWVGVKDRKNIDGTKLKFEYAINKYFGTAMPHDPYNGDIYIERNNYKSNTFFVGLTEEHSSTVGLTGSDDWVGESEISISSEIFTIKVSTSSGITELEIKAFADKYISFSLTYTVIFY